MASAAAPGASRSSRSSRFTAYSTSWPSICDEAASPPPASPPPASPAASPPDAALLWWKGEGASAPRFAASNNLYFSLRGAERGEAGEGNFTEAAAAPPWLYFVHRGRSLDRAQSRGLEENSTWADPGLIHVPSCDFRTRTPPPPAATRRGISGLKLPEVAKGKPGGGDGVGGCGRRAWPGAAAKPPPPPAPPADGVVHGVPSQAELSRLVMASLGEDRGATLLAEHKRVTAAGGAALKARRDEVKKHARAWLRAEEGSPPSP